MDPPRLRRLLRVGSIAIAVISLSAGAAMWAVVSVVAQLGASAGVLPEGGGDLTVVISDTQEAVVAARDVIEDTAELGRGLEEGSRETADALTSAGELIETDVADSLSSVQEAMPALVDASAVIDSTLRALTLFGVDYNPDVPFDQALVGVQSSLKGLPEEVRRQGSDIAALAPVLESTAGDTDALVASLIDMSGKLDRVAETLTNLEGSAARIDTVGSIVAGIDPARPLVVALIAVAVLSGLTLAVVLWRLSDIARVPTDSMVIGT